MSNSSAAIALIRPDWQYKKILAFLSAGNLARFCSTSVYGMNASVFSISPAYGMRTLMKTKSLAASICFNNAGATLVYEPPATFTFVAALGAGGAPHAASANAATSVAKAKNIFCKTASFDFGQV